MSSIGLRIDGRVVFHLTARLRADVAVLDRFEVGDWLWQNLRACFPDALGATLMPNHPHLLVPLSDPELAVARIHRLFGHLARAFDLPTPLGRVSEPVAIADRDKLRRDARYLALNACRAGLVRDPLEWWFSTHRDIVGAIVDPWVAAPRLALALGARRSDFVARYHGYVSGDPSTDVRGTPLPIAAAPTVIPAIPLATIAQATAAALRTSVDAIRHRGDARALFIALAREQGWTNVDQLASACACTRRTIYDLITRPPLDALPPARLCLGDPRLHGHFPRPLDVLPRRHAKL